MHASLLLFPPTTFNSGILSREGKPPKYKYGELLLQGFQVLH